MSKDEIKALATSHWPYFAVSTACELDLFDHIKDGAKTDQGLRNAIKAEGKGFDHLIAFLLDEGFLKLRNGIFCLTEKSELLTVNNPESLKHVTMLWKRQHLDAFKNLKDSIASNTSFFEQRHQTSYFDWIKGDTSEFEIYHRAMDEYARDDYIDIAKAIDLKSSLRVIDIGGGSGRLLSYLRKASPQNQYVLFDEPEVLRLFDVGSVDRIAGNFFLEIDTKADVAILSRIIHDWADSDARRILENVYKILPRHGELFIIENCSDLSNMDHHLLSLNMLVMCNSHERTSIDYIRLVESTGFVHSSITKLNELQFVLKFEKR